MGRAYVRQTCRLLQVLICIICTQIKPPRVSWRPKLCCFHPASEPTAEEAPRCTVLVISPSIETLVYRTLMLIARNNILRQMKDNYMNSQGKIAIHGIMLTPFRFQSDKVNCQVPNCPLWICLKYPNRKCILRILSTMWLETHLSPRTNIQHSIRILERTRIQVQ